MKVFHETENKLTSQNHHFVNKGVLGTHGVSA